MQNQTTIKTWYKFIPNIWLIPENWEVDDFWNIFESLSTKKFQISNKEIQTNWKYFVVDQWNQLIAWFSNNEDKVFKNTPVIVFWDHTTNVKYIDFNFVIWADWTKLLNNKKWDLYYLYSFLEFNKIPSEWYKRHFSILKELSILLPPLKEQQKIANILNTCDNQIETTKQIIQKIEVRNKWLQQQLLTWKKRLSWFSEKWNVLQIWDFSKEISIKNKENNDLIVFSCTKYNGLVPSLEYFWRQIYSDDLTTYKIVPKNTFAYATNHIEEWSIWYQTNYTEWLISPMYTVFKTDKSVDDNFLFRLFKTPHMIYEYRVRMEWSIDRRWGLRWKDFSNIKIRIPKLEEQKAIVNVLDKATKQINEYKEKLEKLELQKKGLMQQLLTGKVKVKLNK